MSNIILHVESANAIVTMVKNQIKNEGKRSMYPMYVKQNNVTADTVIAHKDALLALAYPEVKPNGRADHGTPEREAKKFADKVRLGLTQHVAAAESDDDDDDAPVNLLTTKGLASLAERVKAAGKSAEATADLIRDLAAEVERRTK